LLDQTNDSYQLPHLKKQPKGTRGLAGKEVEIMQPRNYATPRLILYQTLQARQHQTSEE
jgi:hypothetical protein